MTLGASSTCEHCLQIIDIQLYNTKGEKMKAFMPLECCLIDSQSSTLLLNLASLQVQASCGWSIGLQSPRSPPAPHSFIGRGTSVSSSPTLLSVTGCPSHLLPGCSAASSPSRSNKDPHSTWSGPSHAL